MAENVAKIEEKSIQIKEEQKNQGPIFAIFAIFEKFLLNFPQLNLNKKETKDIVVAERTNTNDEETKTQKPEIVRLPDVRKDFPALKLEVEESEQGISPSNMWQVYALGGFMIVRWMWARWRERRANNSNKPETGDEEPTPTDD